MLAVYECNVQALKNVGLRPMAAERWSDERDVAEVLMKVYVRNCFMQAINGKYSTRLYGEQYIICGLYLMCPQEVLCLGKTTRTFGGGYEM